MSRYRKSWTGVIEEVYLGEALKPKDKKVVDAFYDEKEDDQPKANLSSDGKSLWIAGSKAAQWKNGKIEILHAPSGRFDQSVFKYMRKSIPSLNFAKEEVELVEKDVAVPSSIENLKQIVKDKQNAVFMFKDGKVRVDLFSASALVQVYDALKPATKKKFEDMIKTKGGFVKSVDFAFSMAKK